ncbi:MAG TPA: hypothetical protein VF395_02365, partial [Polyangiaceae bacterium]
MRRNDRAPGGAARSERRFWGSLALAVALHVGFAWVIHRQPRARPPVARSERLDFFELSVTEADKPEVFPRERPQDSEPAAAHRPSGDLQVPAPVAASLATSEDVSPPAIAEQAVPRVADSAAPASSASGRGLSLAALGIGWNPFLGRRAEPLAEGRLASPTPPRPPPREAPDPTRAAERRLERS